MSQPELVALLAGISVLLMSVAVGQIVAGSALQARLRIFVRRDPIIPSASVRRQREQSRLAFVEDVNRRLRRANFARKLQKDLVRAGIGMLASRFILIQVMVAASSFIVAYYVTDSIQDLEGIGSIVIGAGAGLLAWFMPLMYLGFMEGRRLSKFEKQLPTTIDAIAGALQAGSSLTQAMEMASREVPPPIGAEIAIVVREMAVGVAMQDAFGNMLERVHSLDLDMLVTAITIQHRVGGNLSQILRTISHTVRERLRIRGEIAILTAQQRLAAWIVSGLPILIILALFAIAPAYISKLFLPGIARILLVMGGMGIAAGFYALRRISDIDV
jgi:tight adherence protein B